MAWEWFVKPRVDGQDESLADFTRRRLGKESIRTTRAAVIGGIYTADPRKLSMASTMPQFVEMEKKYGSLLRGWLRSATAKQLLRITQRRSLRTIVAPRLGMQQLNDALVARLPQGVLRCELQLLT